MQVAEGCERFNNNPSLPYYKYNIACPNQGGGSSGSSGLSKNAVIAISVTVVLIVLMSIGAVWIFYSTHASHFIKTKIDRTGMLAERVPQNEEESQDKINDHTDNLFNDDAHGLRSFGTATTGTSIQPDSTQVHAIDATEGVVDPSKPILEDSQV
ncbi:hypothetical protein RFI_04577 [Reticulomyxa filosa]|uniref:Uncharacterized protein n=1 Tax=Reticulomyxa filosa TaxID=46433 RepID=X6P2T1_RETFI|nr:hypothetical protein RFI_04577 [Reticulomyxa filosa]|eukprot:ETO32541.1 hypothetical protein RFI_04577 [Reticulomyxa filosa]